MPEKTFDFEQLVVDVTAAAALTKAQEKRIADLISNALSVRKVLLNIKIDPRLVGGFQLQIGSSLIDASVGKKLRSLQAALDSMQLKQMTLEKFEELLCRLSKEDKLLAQVQNVGRVVSVKDEIVRVRGMRKVRAGELIDFPNGVQGIVFNFNTQYADVVLLSAAGRLDEGDLAEQTGKVLQVPVGKGLIGRVVNAYGKPIDGQGEIKGEKMMPVEAAVPGIIDRQPVFKPFQTG